MKSHERERNSRRREISGIELLWSHFRAGPDPLAHRTILIANGSRTNFAVSIFLGRRVPHARVVRERLGGKAGGGPRGPEIVAIVPMQSLEPSVTGMRIPGLA